MAQAQAHVAAVQEQWNDLYFRHTFEDTGMYPTPGSLSRSPDVIPAGNSPYGDPSQLIADDNWVKDFGSSTNASVANYIYLRGQNLDTTARDGRLYLYFSPASLLLFPTDPLDPTKGWSKNPLRTSQGAEYITVTAAAKERFVSSEPFLWIPQPISNDHYCVIGRVVTDTHPNEIPTTGNLNDFARYISEHPNLAWRNMVTRNPSSPLWTTSVEYGQGDVGGEVIVYLKCVNAPEGSAVEFSSGTPGTDPPLSIAKTIVKNSSRDGKPYFTASWIGTIPANWTSNITYTWYSENKTPLPDMEISLDVVMPMGSGWDDDLQRYAVPLEALGISDLEGIIPRVGIRVGSQSMVGRTPSEKPTERLPGAAEDASSISLAGVAWEQTRSSILSTTSSDTAVSIAHVVDRSAETQIVSLSEAPPAGSRADLTFDVDLANGSLSGDILVLMATKQVPLGCEIWFENLTGAVPISVPPTKVTNQTSFSVAAMVDLPADYSAKLRCYLLLNGKSLPAGWSAQLSATFVPPDVAEELRGATPEALAQAGPTPGRLLGAVTVKR